MIRIDKQDLQKKPKDELVDELYDSLVEIDKLKRELRKYKNPHTPSSKLCFDKPQAAGLPVGRKLGKKSSHKGKTRPVDTPNHVVVVETDKNPQTGNVKIEETGEVKEVIITDFKIEKIITLYKIKYYRDLNTGEIFLATHPNIPDKGIFGKGVQALASILHAENRVTFNGIASLFTSVFDIPMTTPTAMELCNRAANKLAPKYDGLRDEIKESKVVNGDETSSNQNGKSEWLWGFFTITMAFFTFYKKRGGEIVEEVLGKNFKGILGCDGWITYKIFSEKHGILLQRCWAHLIREVKNVCKDVTDLHDAYIWMCDIFEKVKKTRKLKTESLRKKKHAELVEDMNRWIQIYSSRNSMNELITKVKNGKENWFTCVLHQEIEPTNNSAERGIRKFVILEKIMGCLRSEQGKKTTQVLLSLCQTWKLRGLNPYQELRASL